MRLTAKLSPTQTVTPQMITTVTILQYGAQELWDYLSELSYENPMVELHQPKEPAKGSDFAEKLQWLKNSDRQNRNYYTEDLQTVQNVAAPTAAGSLEAYLLEQLMLLNLDAAHMRGAKTVIGLLDEHGFFDGGIAEVAGLAGVSRAVAREALEQVRRLEPQGVGARNVRECLLTQLRRAPERDPLAEALVETYFDRLAAWSPRQIAARIGATAERVQGALEKIAALSPYPGDGFVSRENVVYVRPDVFIRSGEEGLEVQSNETNLPQITINQTYLHLLRSTQDPEVQHYLREKYAQAEQAVRNLQNRSSTMLRCAQVIARIQDRYFHGGSLCKMTLRDVAEEMGVHESTVSRTVRDKYIQCDQGLFPMHYFFSRSAGQNGNLSRENVKAALAKLLAGEDPARPMSDEQLVAQLSAQHITISRRAVAKYRAELGIPAAYVRKTDKQK